MNPALARVERLNFQNAEDVRLYEEGFYRAFLPKSNPGIRSIWLWDDEAKRLKTKVPYEDQDIFFLRDTQGNINTAGAVNKAMKEFQSEAYGFQKPASAPAWIEIMVAFNNLPEQRRGVMGVFEKVHDFYAPQGYKFVYATCADYSLKWNMRRGWEIVERGDRNGVIRYFLKMPMSRSFLLE